MAKKTKKLAIEENKENKELIFKRNGLYTIGKFYKFNRIKNSEMVQAEKSVEEKRKQFRDLTDEANNLTYDTEMNGEAIQTNKELIRSLKQKINPSEDDINTIVTLLKENKEYLAENRDLKRKHLEFTKKHEQDVEELQKIYKETLADNAVLVFEGMNREEYIENMDEIDRVIIQYIGNIMSMCKVGTPSPKIAKKIQDIIEEENKTKDFQF